MPTDPLPEYWRINFRVVAGEWWTHVDHMLFDSPESALKAAIKYFLGHRVDGLFIIAIRVIPDTSQEYVDWPQMRYRPGSEDVSWPLPERRSDENDGT